MSDVDKRAERGASIRTQVGIEYDIKFAERAKALTEEQGLQDKVRKPRVFWTSLVALRHALRMTTLEHNHTESRGLCVVLQQVSIIHGNALDCELDDAGAIFVYLVPKGLQALCPKLHACLRRDVKIVSYGEWSGLDIILILFFTAIRQAEGKMHAVEKW